MGRIALVRSRPTRVNKPCSKRLHRPFRAICRDKRRAAQSARVFATLRAKLAEPRRLLDCQAAAPATLSTAAQKSVPGRVVRPRSRRLFPQDAAPLPRDRFLQQVHAVPLFPGVRRAGRYHPASATRPDMSSARATVPARHELLPRRPHAGGSSATTRRGQAGNQGEMLHARHSRDMRRAGAAADLTSILYRSRRLLSEMSPLRFGAPNQWAAWPTLPSRSRITLVIL